MSINKVVSNHLLMFLFLVLSFNIFKKKTPFKVIETDSLSIKLSNDGMGIVKDIKCSGCDFNFVRITHNSKASIQGVEVNVLQARERAGQPCMVSFNPETQEVQYIRW